MQPLKNGVLKKDHSPPPISCTLGIRYSGIEKYPITKPAAKTYYVKNHSKNKTLVFGNATTPVLFEKLKQR